MRLQEESIAAIGQVASSYPHGSPSPEHYDPVTVPRGALCSVLCVTCLIGTIPSHHLIDGGQIGYYPFRIQTLHYLASINVDLLQRGSELNIPFRIYGHHHVPSQGNPGEHKPTVAYHTNSGPWHVAEF